MKLSLQGTLLALTATALLAGIVPAAITLDRLLAGELEAKLRADVARAPRLLADRNGAVAEALRMHAREVARAPGLGEALLSGDRASALGALESARGSFAARAILVSADGAVWAGPAPDPAMIEATRRGETPVAVISEGESLHNVALAPVLREGSWSGAAGVTVPLDDTLAGTLAPLVRCEVVILGTDRRVVAASNDGIAAAVSGYGAELPWEGGVHATTIGGRRYLISLAPLNDAATVVFVTDVEQELAVLPKLRGVIGLMGAAALILGLLLGTVFATAVARPVRGLAAAADRLAAGDFEAPLAGSSIREVDHLSQAFHGMRRSLAERLHELEHANRELADRQERLGALKAELLQRERLAASGRLVAELAHEIRNPVANLRNTLELIRRRLQHDPEGLEFANMAVDELLRMHQLAEQMLDLNRPRDPGVSECDVAGVSREVAELARAGVSPEELEVVVEGEAEAAIGPDALKQVLLNLVQNSREAMRRGLEIEIRIQREGSRVVIDVTDNGPGIPPEILPRVFDPFFTTKGSVYGVGLGLFIADGVLRKHGGRITAMNREVRSGACFRIELMPSQAAVPEEASRSKSQPAEEESPA